MFDLTKEEIFQLALEGSGVVQQKAEKVLCNALDQYAPQTASPGMAYSEVAASAYRAYAASTGNKNFRGEPMPEFDDLPVPIQIAWEAAIRQAETCFNGRPRNEQDWAGWIPPHLDK